MSDTKMTILWHSTTRDDLGWMVADARTAIEAAQARADDNGAPVAVLSRDGWYVVVEDAELMDEIIDDEGWLQEAIVDPTNNETD